MLEFTFLKRWFQNTTPCTLCGERRRIGDVEKLLPPFLCRICATDLDMLPFGTDVWHTEVAEQLRCSNIDGLAVISIYQWPYDKWLTRLKFHQQLYLSLTLGYLMARQIEQQDWYDLDYICALPLHFIRESQRGYNQAQLLVNAIIEYSNREFTDFHGLKRRRYTRPQTKLDRLERHQNTANAFICRTPLFGKAVLLVDDVITTGASVASATEALKQAGADKVYVTCGAVRILN